MGITIIRKPVSEKPVFRNPNLAGEGILGQISYPKIWLPKLNGVRGGNQHGNLIARSLKPIPNTHTRKKFSGASLSNLEGELVVGPFDDKNVFTNSTSGVMSEDGAPDVSWWLFDFMDAVAPFIDRLKMRDDAANKDGRHGLILVPWGVVKSDDELEEIQAKTLAQKYEGLVLRNPRALYKFGRSTDLEGDFLRFVPWRNGEALILDIEEGSVNLNESKPNELGFLKKSSHKANKVPSGRAGAFVIKDLITGLVFNIPVPTVALQDYVWANKEKFVGKIAKYKYKDPSKFGGKPRYGQFEGLRSPLDMS